MKYTLRQRQHICLSNLILLPIGFFWLLLPSSMVAQKYYTAETTFLVKLGTTRPIYETSGIAVTDADKSKAVKANKPRIIPNFAGRRHLEKHNPNALPSGADPLYNASGLRMPEYEIPIILNFEGIDQTSSGATPPDVNGDVGRDFFVEIVNASLFRVFDKAGHPVSGIISTNSIWSQVGQSALSDPIILYDQDVDRWFLSDIGSSSQILIAISQTSDPRGSWDAYTFTTPRFPDFPKFSVWSDAYYMTTNESGNSFPLYAFNREDLLAGAATVKMQRLTVPKLGGVFFEVGAPVDWDGLTPPPAGSPGIVVKLIDDDWGFSTEDKIMLHKISIDWQSPASSNVEVIALPTTPYDTDGCQLESTGGFSCVPQPNGQGIDGAQWIICNKAQYRNFNTHESFVISFMVDATGDDVAGIRWMEFRRTAPEDWHIYQEGTVGSDDGIHRFMPSIGIDGDGNIGLGYAVSGYNKFPSLRFTGRYAFDDPGIMSFRETEIATGQGDQGGDRYGDYFAMSVDPTDDATFWFAGQYLPEDNQWSTRVATFSAARDTFDIFPIQLLEPASDGLLGAQNVSFKVYNRGINTLYAFPLAYQLHNENWVIENPVLDSLPRDEEFNYTFTMPVDIPVPGNYPIRVATLLDIDGNKRNDTLNFMITKYATRDVALQYSLSNSGIICSDEAENTIIISNAGLDTVRNILFELQVNGNIIQHIEWTGILPFGEETEFNFPVSLSEEGTYDFFMTVISVNSDDDETIGNNEINWQLTAQPDGKQVFLNFTTDNFPQESTWKLFDATNTEIAAGGPYAEKMTLFIEEFCLDPEACYTFTVYDAFGDGMSAQGVKGDFEIFNDEGELLADLFKPNFGSQSSSQFCLTAQCLFSMDVGIEHESSPGAGDAIAIVEASNSLGTIAYSIDGGNTFQSSATFLNLVPGSYSLIAKDGAGCMDTVQFEILACNLQALITTAPAIGGDVGEIHVVVSGNLGSATYSINGSDFTVDSFFVMLEPGDYVITVRDSAGCEIVDTVTVSTSVSTSRPLDDSFIQISPNPGNGIYQFAASLDSKEVFIAYTMVTATGGTLFSGNISKYNDLYKGEISLVAYPAGIYYIVLRVDRQLIISRMIRV